MKPTIELSDDRVKLLIAIAHQRAEMAHAAARRLESAIRPIFVFPGPRRKPLQVGSCVLAIIKDELFAFSASHVFDDVGQFQVPIGCGDQLIYLSGERFSSGRGASGTHRDDAIDVSVLHIRRDAPKIVWESALAVGSLDVFSESDPRGMYIAAGYRSSQSGSQGRLLNSQLDFVPSFEFDDRVYLSLGIDRTHFTAVAYDKEVLIGGTWQSSPSPRGMSGGAMFRIQGLPADPTAQPAPAPEPKLGAIITELRPASAESPQALIGSKIAHHLSLIHQFLPGLLEETRLPGSR